MSKCCFSGQFQGWRSGVSWSLLLMSKQALLWRCSLYGLGVDQASIAFIGGRGVDFVQCYRPTSERPWFWFAHIYTLSGIAQANNVCLCNTKGMGCIKGMRRERVSSWRVKQQLGHVQLLLAPRLFFHSLVNLLSPLLPSHTLFQLANSMVAFSSIQCSVGQRITLDSLMAEFLRAIMFCLNL